MLIYGRCLRGTAGTGPSSTSDEGSFTSAQVARLGPSPQAPLPREVISERSSSSVSRAAVPLPLHRCPSRPPSPQSPGQAAPSFHLDPRPSQCYPSRPTPAYPQTSRYPWLRPGCPARHGVMGRSGTTASTRLGQRIHCPRQVEPSRRVDGLADRVRCPVKIPVKALGRKRRFH
jgi:hypothetical protein